MGYQDRDKRENRAANLPEEKRFDLASLASGAVTALVRVAGLVLVLVGLWAGVKVVLEAWGLYRDPTAVERLATVIDRASHIDALISPRAAATPTEGAARPGSSTQAPAEPFRPSYFLAWAVAILLLLLVGKLASWTVRAGGQLALSTGASPPGA
jgi:disulfide bond formation protein DsbB